jgi:hypothetical protein
MFGWTQRERPKLRRWRMVMATSLLVSVQLGTVAPVQASEAEEFAATCIVLDPNLGGFPQGHTSPCRCSDPRIQAQGLRFVIKIVDCPHEPSP